MTFEKTQSGENPKKKCNHQCVNVELLIQNEAHSVYMQLRINVCIISDAFVRTNSTIQKFPLHHLIYHDTQNDVSRVFRVSS